MRCWLRLPSGINHLRKPRNNNILKYFAKVPSRNCFSLASALFSNISLGQLLREDAYLYHLRHVALRPGVVCLVLHSHQHYEVQVVPHVVLIFNMLLKGHRLVVELVPFESWERQSSTEKAERR